MSEMKHTEGPWRLDSNSDYRVLAADGTTITDQCRTGLVEEIKANAKLIAAAPETAVELAKVEAELEVAKEDNASLRAEKTPFTIRRSLARKTADEVPFRLSINSLREELSSLKAEHARVLEGRERTIALLRGDLASAHIRAEDSVQCIQRPTREGNRLEEINRTLNIDIHGAKVAKYEAIEERDNLRESNVDWQRNHKISCSEHGKTMAERNGARAERDRLRESNAELREMLAVFCNVLTTAIELFQRQWNENKIGSAGTREILKYTVVEGQDAIANAERAQTKKGNDKQAETQPPQ